MLQISKIQNSFLGIVGFKQPYNPNYAIVNAANQLSSSGYFVTDNPYVKIEYIKDNQDYLNISDSDFNIVLEDIQKRSVSNVLNQVFNEYDFIDRSLMYKNASNKIDLESLPIGFVGYQIQVTKDKNVAFNLSRVLLDFDGTGDIELILWNTAKKEPLFTKVVTIASDHQVEELNWTLDNSNDTYKGEYYVGYINDGSLTVTPFKREFNNANVLTQPTNLCIEAVKVVGHSGTSLFDLNDVDGMSEDSGLNFDISVYEDFTDFALNSKMLFARAIQLDSMISCIQLYLSTLRSNANQTQSAQLYQKIMIELEGTDSDSPIVVKGLKNQLIGEIATIRNEIVKMRKGFTKSGCIMLSTLE
jgi:hypothetical protein